MQPKPRLAVNQNFSGGADFASNEKLIHKLAYKAYMRARAAGFSLALDDCRQEICIAWWKASQGFKPELGNRFSTYFVKAAFAHINQIFEREERSTTKLGLVSMTLNTDSDGDGDLDEVLDIDTSVSPEETAMMAEAYEVNVASASRTAKLVMMWLVNPPSFLEEEARMRQAKAKAKNGGMGIDGRPVVTLGMIIKAVSRLFVLSKVEIDTLKHELKDVEAKLT